MGDDLFFEFHQCVHNLFALLDRMRHRTPGQSDQVMDVFHRVRHRGHSRANAINHLAIECGQHREQTNQFVINALLTRRKELGQLHPQWIQFPFELTQIQITGVTIEDRGTLGPRSHVPQQQLQQTDGIQL